MVMGRGEGILYFKHVHGHKDKIIILVIHR